MNINNTEEIRAKYDKKASSYDMAFGPMEKMMMGKWRKLLCSKANGLVLEAGVGTGANLAHYPENSNIEKVIGIDFSPKMLEVAKGKVLMAKVPIELIEADIQNLHFEEDIFDTIITACVFCSVPDPVLGFKELRRVIKSSGKLYLLEHVRSEGIFLGPLMDKLNALSVKLSGVNINRTTEKNIELSGMKIVSVEPLLRDIVKLITVSPNKQCL
ncbi:MAG: hypothetical protein JM58_15040 [Peptococcaceae bacterium BICA1-8]|nr:MAG: hypothetical protein JM58_15040 [Peptococcaceae bacterium BICA1-8]